MPRTPKSEHTSAKHPEDPQRSGAASLDDRLVDIVTDFTDGRSRSHALVAGGFGTGKSRAVGVAAVAAAVSGARVARLEQGPVGISSFDDFLAAVNDAASGSEVRPAPGSSVASLAGVNEDPPLVIVVEGLDQLLRQMRAGDRPAFSELLTAPGGPLVIGTAILGVLPDEFTPFFSLLRTVPVAPMDGVLIAVERALRERVLPPSVGDVLLQESRHIELALLGNQSFWSLAGAQLAAGARNPLIRAEGELRALMKAHFSALLLRVAPSEQRVLLEIARAGAPRTVQEIAEATDVRNQAAASAIARLHADGWVVNIPPPIGADRRRSWYEIADPLLRLHLRPQGAGSVSDLIRSVVDVWQATDDVAVHTLTAEDLGRLDVEAVRRGESGEPEVARAWFQEALPHRVDASGLRAKDTLDGYWALGVWTGNAGDRARALRMLSTAIKDIDELFGAGSREAIEARSNAARNLMELGAFADAQRRYAEVRELALRAGAADLAAQATQDLGRALGEQGLVEEAVEQIAAALDEGQDAARNDPATRSGEGVGNLPRAQRGLAYWLARAGDTARAMAILDELLEDPTLSDRDRQRAAFDRVGVVALVDRPRAVDEYQRLATEVDASGNDPELARSVRLAAFELAVDEWPGDPGRWPVRAVDDGPLHVAVVRLLQNGDLDLQGLAKVLVQVSGLQVRALAPRLVAVTSPLPPGQRAALARTIVPHLQRAAEQRLFSDLAAALEGDPSGAANLPDEWRHVVAAMREIDRGAEIV